MEALAVLIWHTPLIKMPLPAETNRIVRYVVRIMVVMLTYGVRTVGM